MVNKERTYEDSRIPRKKTQKNPEGPNEAYGHTLFNGSFCLQDLKRTTELSLIIGFGQNLKRGHMFLPKQWIHLIKLHAMCGMKLISLVTSDDYFPFLLRYCGGFILRSSANESSSEAIRIATYTHKLTSTIRDHKKKKSQSQLDFSPM